MGMGYELTCSGCGYQSEMLLLGQGMDGHPERIVGSCCSCNKLTTISVNEDSADCGHCNQQGTVVFTSFSVRPRPTNTNFQYRLIHYECPRCRAFSIPKGEFAVLWD